MKSIRIWLAATMAVLALALGTAPAAAQTISSNTSGTIVILSNVNKVAGQTVTPPSSGPLQNYTLYILRTTATLSVTPIIYEWDPLSSTGVGPPLWTGASVAVTTGTGGGYLPYTFSPNIALNPSKQYVLGVMQTVPGESGYLEVGFANNVPGNSVWRNDPTWSQNSAVEAHFSATFAPPAPVPTLPEWAMILFGLILAGGAALHLQRRRALA
jgi:hypothetical protein